MLRLVLPSAKLAQICDSKFRGDENKDYITGYG
jgi:hypothetical protein